MEFRTVIKCAEKQDKLSHNHHIVMMGSCFTDSVGARMRAAMISVDVNPFGTIYNPLSIAAAINRIIDCRLVTGDELFPSSGVWNCYAFHSRFSRSDKMAAMNAMNESIERCHAQLKRARAVIITLGTAMVYSLKSTGEVVSNCHKVPQSEFDRNLESVDSIEEVLSEMVLSLCEFNPDIKVIFTISPIRHIADGIETNSLSKATLRVAVGKLVERFRGIVDYFPSYEIMLDDLRDYRFYATDMLHPNETAVEYIWRIFQSSYFDDRAAQAIARCERVYKRLTHRPMSDNREVVERFRAETATVVRNLVKEYPYLMQIKEVKNIID